MTFGLFVLGFAAISVITLVTTHIVTQVLPASAERPIYFVEYGLPFVLGFVLSFVTGHWIWMLAPVLFVVILEIVGLVLAYIMFGVYGYPEDDKPEAEAPAE